MLLVIINHSLFMIIVMRDTHHDDNEKDVRIKSILPDKAKKKLLPKKSSEKYTKEFDLFQRWADSKHYAICENTLILYAEELGTKFSPNTIRSKI